MPRLYLYEDQHMHPTKYEYTHNSDPTWTLYVIAPTWTLYVITPHPGLFIKINIIYFKIYYFMNYIYELYSYYSMSIL